MLTDTEAVNLLERARRAFPINPIVLALCDELSARITKGREEPAPPTRERKRRDNSYFKEAMRKSRAKRKAEGKV